MLQNTKAEPSKTYLSPSTDPRLTLCNINSAPVVYNQTLGMPERDVNKLDREKVNQNMPMSVSDINSTTSSPNNCESTNKILERPIRILLSQPEAARIIGRRGFNIRVLRDQFKSALFHINDSGGSSDRVLDIETSVSHLTMILEQIVAILVSRSDALSIAHKFSQTAIALNSRNETFQKRSSQVQLKLLLDEHCASFLIGTGGSMINKLRKETRVGIRIFDEHCPMSTERVCSLKGCPKLVVQAVKTILTYIMRQQIPSKLNMPFVPYNPSNFDPVRYSDYGGNPPDSSLWPKTPHTATPILNIHQQQQLMFSINQQMQILQNCAFQRGQKFDVNELSANKLCFPESSLHQPLMMRQYPQCTCWADRSPFMTPAILPSYEGVGIFDRRYDFFDTGCVSKEKITKHRDDKHINSRDQSQRHPPKSR